MYNYTDFYSPCYDYSLMDLSMQYSYEFMDPLWSRLYLENPGSLTPLWIIGGIMLKESDDLVIWGVIFDSTMTHEKHICSVSRAASRRLFILKKSWRVFHVRSLLVRGFWGFVLHVLEYRSAVWCSAAYTHLKLLYRVVSGARLFTGVYLSETLLIVDLWQYCVCCIRSGEIRRTLLMVLCLDRVCQCALHAVLWPHIGILMRRCAAEPHSIAGLLFPS